MFNYSWKADNFQTLNSGGALYPGAFFQEEDARLWFWTRNWK